MFQRLMSAFVLDFWGQRVGVKINFNFQPFYFFLFIFISNLRTREYIKIRKKLTLPEFIPKGMKQHKSDSPSPGNSGTYSDNIYSEDYIGQFLDFTDHQKHSYSEDINNHENLKTSQALINCSSALNENDGKNLDNEERLKSSFHNFQKHLVTTLRHFIDFKSMAFPEEIKQIAEILWNFFLKCHKMTRTLIYLVYGGISMESAKAKRFNRQYGLERLIRNYPALSIKQAQRIIRKESLKQIEKIDFQWEMQHRRIRNKNGFRIYFETFIEELRDDGFNKRLPKEKRQRVEQKNQLQDLQCLPTNKV